MENNQPNPKVTAAIDEINKEFALLVQEGRAVFQRKSLEQIHLPVLVYGKMSVSNKINEETQETEKVYNYDQSVPLSYSYFTGGNALIGMQAMEGNDPRFMSLKEAMVHSDVSIKADAKYHTFIMENKNTHKAYLARFVNFADLTGTVINEHDIKSVISPERDKVAERMLSDLSKKKTYNKTYGMAYYAYKEAIAPIRHDYTAEALDKLARAKEPFVGNFNERLAAINNFNKPITSKSLPQDRFMYYMKEAIKNNELTAANGNKSRSYVMIAAEHLFTDKFNISQIKACINNFAPED